MLDEKKIEEIRNLVPKLVNEGIIAKKEEHKKLTNFFVETAEDSISSAQLLYKVSTNHELQDLVGFPNLKGFLWVINASYYSMFYMVNALLANSEIKIKSEIGVHKLTFDAFVYYFYLTNKIAKEYVEEFLEAMEDSSQLLGKDEQKEIFKKAKEKAEKLVFDLDFEREKRRIFTYDLEKKKIEAKAKTSLDRATHFYMEILKLMKQKARKG